MNSSLKKLLLIPLFLSLFIVTACDISSDGIQIIPGEGDNSDDDIEDPVIEDDNEEDEDKIINIITDEFDLNMSYGKLSDNDFEAFITIDGDYNTFLWDLTNIDYKNAGIYDVFVDINNGFETKTIKVNLYDDINIPTLITYDIESDVTGDPIKEDEIDQHIQISSNNTGIVTKSWILYGVEFDKVGSYAVDVKLVFGNGAVSIETIKIHVLDYSLPTILTTKFNYNMSDRVLTNSDVNAFIIVGGNTAIVNSLSWDLTNVDFTVAGEYNIDVTLIYNSSAQLNSNITIKLFDDVNVPSVDTSKILRDIADGEMFDYDMHNHVNVTNYNTGVTELNWNLSGVDFFTNGTYFISVIITYGNNLSYSENIEIEIYGDAPPVVGVTQINYSVGNDFNSYDWITNLSISDDSTHVNNLILDLSDLSRLNHNIQYGNTQSFLIRITDMAANVTTKTIYLDFISTGYSDDQIYDVLYKSSVRIYVRKAAGTELGSGTIIDYEKSTNSMIISTNSHVTEGSTSNFVRIFHGEQKPAGNYLPTLCAEIKVSHPGFTNKPDVAILEVVGEMDPYDTHCIQYYNIDLSLYENDFRVLDLVRNDSYIYDIDPHTTSFYTMGYPLNVLSFGKYTYSSHGHNMSSTSGYISTMMYLTGYANNSGASGSLIVDQNLNLVAIYTGRTGIGNTTSIGSLNNSVKIGYQDYCNLDPNHLTKDMCQNL